MTGHERSYCLISSIFCSRSLCRCYFCQADRRCLLRLDLQSTIISQSFSGKQHFMVFAVPVLAISWLGISGIICKQENKTQTDQQSRLSLVECKRLQLPLIERPDQLCFKVHNPSSSNTKLSTDRLSPASAEQLRQTWCSLAHGRQLDSGIHATKFACCMLQSLGMKVRSLKVCSA